MMHIIISWIRLGVGATALGLIVLLAVVNHNHRDPAAKAVAWDTVTKFWRRNHS